MTQTKFTPGPWVAVDEGRGRDRNWCVMVPEESRFGPYIATIHNTADHAKANAHLIAAAPCMAIFIKKHADAGDAEAIELWGRINGG